MKYIIKPNETHPLYGHEFVLFRIIRVDDKWVRNDAVGVRWGFKHPDSGEIVHVWPAGVGSEPKLGPITGAYTVIEVPTAEAKWFNEDFTAINVDDSVGVKWTFDDNLGNVLKYDSSDDISEEE